MAKSPKLPAARAENQPATRKLLYLVRDELRSEVRTIHQKMDTGFKDVRTEFKNELAAQIGSVRTDLDSKIGGLRTELKSEISDLRTDLEAQISGLRAEIGELRTEFREMKNDLSEMKTAYTRMEILLEEQNSNNRIVLDAIQALWQRQDRIEAKVEAKG